MAVNQATGYNRTTREPLDALYLNSGSVYTSIAAVNTAVDINVRYTGSMFNVNGELYWYKEGVQDSNLVIFTDVYSFATTQSFQDFTQSVHTYTQSNDIRVSDTYISQSNYLPTASFNPISSSFDARVLANSASIYSIVHNSGSLATLTDVVIASLTPGQALVYDTGTSKWKNASYISASISGNAATATNVAASGVTSPGALTRTNDTNVTLTLGGSPTTALLAATSLTVGWTGTLADARITSATNWNLAYAYSLIGHLPLAGGNVSGNIFMSGGAAIDASLTGGVDVLNIGTSNSDTINIGWSGATVNIQGTVLYNNVTNLQVTDKLITVNKGGAAASGVSAGFEVEEGGVITGYFATDSTRTGWDFKAPTSQQLTLGLDLLSAARVIKMPNASGTIALLTSLSSTATGLTYTNTSGVFSLTSGYVIPTTTEQSNWNTAYGWGNHTGLYYTLGSTVANSTKWAGFDYTGVISTTPVYAMMYNSATSDWRPIGASGLATFLSGQTMNIVGNASTATNVAASGVTGGAALSLTDDTNITITQTGSTSALLAAKGLIMGWTGTLADARITSSGNWNTAYNYSQIGHLPLSGGNVTGRTVFAKSAQTSYSTAALEVYTADGAASEVGISFHRSGQSAGFLSHGSYGGLRWNGTQLVIADGSTYAISISGNAATATLAANSTLWNGYAINLATYGSAAGDFLNYDNSLGIIKPFSTAQIQTKLGLGSSAYINASVTPTASTIVQRDGSGYIEGVYFKATNTGSLTTGLTTLTGKYNTGDNYLYQFTDVAVRAWLGIPSGGETLASVTGRGNSTSTAVYFNNGAYASNFGVGEMSYTSNQIYRASANEMYVNYSGTGQTIIGNSAGITLNAATTINGTIYANSNIYLGDYLILNNKLALRGTDSYLRLNQNGEFSSGIYTPYNLRVEGTTTFGSGTYYASSTAANLPATTINGSATVNGYVYPYAIINQSSVGTDNNFGLFFGTYAEGADYVIRRRAGSWTSPNYQPLDIKFYTGIRIGADYSYGGTIFYSSSNLATALFSVGSYDTNIRMHVGNQKLITYNAGSGIEVEAIQASYFGYSSSYAVLQLGDTRANRSIAFGVDLTGNVAGTFNGTGLEYIWKNVGKFITPNASNNGYNLLFNWDNVGSITLGNHLSTAGYNINAGVGTVYAATFIGNLSGASSINIRGAGGTGGMSISGGGSGSNTGYLEWWNGSSVRQAYMGYNNTNLTLVMESGEFQVTGTTRLGVLYATTSNFSDTINASAIGSNIRLKGDGGVGNDGFVGAIGDGTLYFRNWSGTRGFSISPSNVLAHSGAIIAAANSTINGTDRVLVLNGSGGGANSLLRYSDAGTAKWSTGFNGGNYIIYDDVNGAYRATISTTGATFNGAFNVSGGRTTLTHTQAGVSYTQSTLEVYSSGSYGPRISLHYGGVVASQIGIESSGRIAILNNPGTGYENLIAGYGEFVGDIVLTTGTNRQVQIGSSTNYYWRLKTNGDNFRINMGADALTAVEFTYPTGAATFASSISATSGTFSSIVQATNFYSTLSGGEVFRMAGSGSQDFWLQGGGTFRIVNTGYSQQLFLVNQSGNSYSYGTSSAEGGFIKGGSSNSYFLLGGGGHVATSTYAIAANYLPLAGGTMTGNIAMSSYSITGANSFNTTGAILNTNQVYLPTSGSFHVNYSGGGQTHIGNTAAGIYMYNTIDMNNYTIGNALNIVANSGMYAGTVYSNTYRNTAGEGIVSYASNVNYIGGGAAAHSLAFYAGGQNRMQLSTGGSLVQNTQVVYPNAKWGASSGTGPVVIKIPGGSSNYGMITMTIQLYEYNSNAASTITVGGHNWSGQWYYMSADVVGYTNKPVRFGFKDGQYCVIIGDASSTWSYGQVVVTRVQNGEYYSGSIDLGGTWSVALESDSYTWVTGDYRYLKTPKGMSLMDGVMTMGVDDTYGTAYNAIGFSGGTTTNAHNKIFAHSGSSAGLFINAASGHNVYLRSGGSEIGYGNTSNWYFPQTTNSTSYGSGALTVAGGVGVGGNLYTGGNIVSGGGVTAGNWFYNSGKTGLYNNSYGGHFYQTDANYWTITGGSTATMGLKFAYSHESTVYGYVYHDGNGFGLLNQGAWAVRTNGSSDNELHGVWKNTTQLNLSGNGVNVDPYGLLNITNSSAANYTYIGLTRSTVTAIGMGINTSNEFWVGGTTSGGASSVLSGTAYMRLQSGGVYFSNNIHGANNLYLNTGGVVPSINGNGGIRIVDSDNSNDVTLSLPSSAMLDIDSSLTAVHYSSNSFVSIAYGTGAGTFPTIGIEGNDVGMRISVTIGTSPAASATIATITFGTAYTTFPSLVFSPGNANAATLTGAKSIYVDNGASPLSSFILVSGTTPLTETLTYVWYVHAIQADYPA